MKTELNRRSLLKSLGIVGVGLGLGGLGLGIRPSSLWAGEVAAGAPTAEKLGWRLAIQAWTFRNFTFFEAVDKTASLGLKYIEAFPGQKLSAEHGDITVNEGMSAEARKDMLKKLSDSGVTLVNFGVCALPADEAACRGSFEFAKEMGIETMVSEPDESMFPMLDKLANEYGVNVALHNHPKPSHYWDPQIELDAFNGYSKRIGACCDTGHWVRSGLDPVECLKALEGRIISLHFKDVNKEAGDAHDVPWGTGVNHADEALTELHRQGVKAVFSIEYEYNWDNSLPEIAQCVAWFEKEAQKIQSGG